MVGLVFSTSSVTGLAMMISRFPSFNQWATFAGAAYLIYIAVLIARSALRQRPASDDTQSLSTTRDSFWRAWRTGVLTNITNMKTIAFMISIFAGFLAVERSLSEKAAVIAICSSFEILWYSSVALVFGQGTVQRFYNKYCKEIDIGLAIFLVGFALQTVWPH